MNKKLIAVLPAFLGGLDSQAQVLSNVTPDGEGQFIYSYEIQNSAQFSIFQLSLSFSFDESLRDWNPLDVTRGGDVSAPLGDLSTFLDDWQADVPLLLSTQGSFVQDFTAINSFGFGDVLQGESLSGFSFTSAFAPEEISYTVFGPAGDSLSGVVQGPSGMLVPEPSGALLLGASLLLCVRNRRR